MRVDQGILKWIFINPSTTDPPNYILKDPHVPPFKLFCIKWEFVPSFWKQSVCAPPSSPPLLRDLPLIFLLLLRKGCNLFFLPHCYAPTTHQNVNDGILGMLPSQRTYPVMHRAEAHAPCANERQAALVKMGTKAIRENAAQLLGDWILNVPITQSTLYGAMKVS